MQIVGFSSFKGPSFDFFVPVISGETNMDIKIVCRLGMKRQQEKCECIASNEWLDLEPEKEIAEDLRSELNSDFWDEDYRLAGALLAETEGEKGEDLVRGLFGLQNPWEIDDLHACMPRYCWRSIPTLCYRIGAYKRSDGQFWR
jgi:hypothetical protein